MSYHETIIIGAGPGGLACALTLARQGRDVLLLEKKKHIGPKVCAGGVTWSGILNRVPEFLIERSFCSQDIRSAWQKTTISSSTPMIATISREKMGQWQAAEAVKAGARIMTGTGVRSISNNSVTTDQGSYRFRYLVGADGSTSQVRAFLGLPTTDIGIGIHHEVAGDFSRMEWHLNSRLFKSGYAWIFPHHNQASIGAYCYRQDMTPKTLHNNFQVWAKGQGINLGNSKPRAAVINFDYRGWQFGNIFLAGDAAGLASGLTGEGIFPAILSGETVAHSIMGQKHQPGLDALLKKHNQHRRFLKLAALCGFSAAAIMELMVAALRLGLFPWNTLEMGE